MIRRTGCSVCYEEVLRFCKRLNTQTGVYSLTVWLLLSPAKDLFGHIGTSARTTRVLLYSRIYLWLLSRVPVPVCPHPSLEPFVRLFDRDFSSTHQRLPLPFGRPTRKSKQKDRRESVYVGFYQKRVNVSHRVWNHPPLISGSFGRVLTFIGPGPFNLGFVPLLNPYSDTWR